MSVDESRLRTLLEEAEDLNSDGMRATRLGLDEIVETGLERRRGDAAEAAADRRAFIRRSMFAAGGVAGFGAAWLGRASLVAQAADSDVVMLQTSAAIENLAIAVYKQAAGLPPATSGAAIPAVKDFVVATISHHTQHAQAFNAAVQKLGGQPQNQPDNPVLTGVVAPAVAKIKGPADVVALALTLEDAAAQTYVKFAGVASDVQTGVATWASIAPVEAQHVAILMAVQALLGSPQDITIPLPLAALPAAAGSAGLGSPKMPQISFYPSTDARPPDEGRVGG